MKNEKEKKNDIIVIEEDSMSPSFQPQFSTRLTGHDLERVSQQLELIKSFIKNQLKEGIENDYAVIPSTKKKSLLKAGAEKLLNLFQLGVQVQKTDQIFDRDGNFALFIYKAKVYRKSTQEIIAECEGSANSQEKKYKERRVWRGNQQHLEETPVTDILNTLMKMAQKRAIVGATIIATGASDFFTQDLDDDIEREQLGAKATVKNEEPKRSGPPICCGKTMMISKYIDQNFGHKPFYCPECKSKVRAE